MVHQVTLIRGDGSGPELIEASRRVLEASGVQFQWDVQEAGMDALEKYGTPLPPSVLDSVRRTHVAFKAPVTTPVGGGYRSVNVAIRMEFGLYANVRPAKWYPGVRSRYPGVDLVVLRENTEGEYSGVEFDKGQPETLELMRWLRAKRPRARLPDDSGLTVKPISDTGSRRIARFAFEYARAHSRKKVTAVSKANIMKSTDGLFLRVAREVAKDYADIAYEELLVDNACMQLVQMPESFDVLVMPNLYGDILSDLAAGLVGGLGVAPSANIGAHEAVFEAVHGSAPQFKGTNKLNPTALILSGVLMLHYLGEEEAAERVESAVAAVISEGKQVTSDMKPDPKDPTAVGTSEMADAIIAKMQERK